MYDPLIIDTAIHWGAVILYVVATIANVWGVIFRNEKTERNSYRIALAGLCVHSAALLYRWKLAGHGPYMAHREVLSSDAWVMLVLFLVFMKFYPRVKPASIIVFPATFMLIALGLFFNPAVKKIPPTLRSIWLVLHVSFYKIALGTILVALAFSIFYILKNRKSFDWLARLPDKEILDLYAFRFAGFGFVFWAIAMLAGSIWAYQSWGRFWAWDPVETWSLITWLAFGIYLHLRRFFGWKGERAAYFYIICFALSIIAVFFTSVMESSIHSEYFK
ncbi:MAG: cytochrome c assembly [Geobacteraceae bacterium]|nr:MAG: cytochrome c assembly [Geobacteraceae bacterium]